jgi:hypothetical protein
LYHDVPTKPINQTSLFPGGLLHDAGPSANLYIEEKTVTTLSCLSLAEIEKIGAGMSGCSKKSHWHWDEWRSPDEMRKFKEDKEGIHIPLYKVQCSIILTHCDMYPTLQGTMQQTLHTTSTACHHTLHSMHPCTTHCTPYYILTMLTTLTILNILTTLNVLYVLTIFNLLTILTILAIAS